jgi:hypothetical protein
MITNYGTKNLIKKVQRQMKADREGMLEKASFDRKFGIVA